MIFMIYYGLGRAAPHAFAGSKRVVEDTELQRPLGTGLKARNKLVDARQANMGKRHNLRQSQVHDKKRNDMKKFTSFNHKL